MTIATIVIGLVVFPLWAYGFARLLQTAMHALAGWWWARTFDAMKDRRLGR